MSTLTLPAVPTKTKPDEAALRKKELQDKADRFTEKRALETARERRQITKNHQ